MRQVTRVQRDAFGKNGFGSLSLRDFVVGAYATASSLRLALAFLLSASFLSPFFRSSGEWLVELRHRAAATFFLKLLDAFIRRLELTTQIRDQIDEHFGPDPTLPHILLELVNGIHGPAGLINPPNLGNAAFT